MSVFHKFNQRNVDLLRNLSPDKRFEELSKLYIAAKISVENQEIAQELEYIIRNPDNICERFNCVLEKIEDTEERLRGILGRSSLDKNVQYELLSRIRGVQLTVDNWKEIVYNLVEMFARERIMNVIQPNLSVNRLEVALLDVDGGTFFDGTAGSGASLRIAHDYATRKHAEIGLFAQESCISAVKTAKLLMFLSDIEDTNIVCGDTLGEPGFLDGNNLMKFDYVIMDTLTGIRLGEEYYMEYDKYDRFVYGQPNKSSYELIYISHLLKTLKDDAKGIAIVPNGILFRGAREGEVRRNIINSDVIESVIALSTGLYPHTSVQVNVVIFNKNKPEHMRDKIQFINAESLYEQETRSQRIIADSQIQRIVDCYNTKPEEKEFSTVVSIAELEDYNLLPRKYLVSTKTVIDGYGEVKFDKDAIEGLKTTELVKLGKFYRGINITSRDLSQDETGVKVINMSDVQNGEIDIEALSYYTIPNNARVEAYRVQVGDLLISVRGSALKIAVVPEHEGDILVSQNFIGFRPNAGTDVKYLKAYLESPLGQYLLQLCQSGTSIPTIKSKDLEKLPVKLIDDMKGYRVIERFECKKQEINQRLRELEEELKECHLELYNEMGITRTFSVK